MSMNNIVVISFNSLFVGMSFAIEGLLLVGSQRSNGFNSLFVGMSFAIRGQRRGSTLSRSFNSLFVGMSFAILP